MSWFYILAWFPTALAVLGNALVVFIIVARLRLRISQNWFVLSLAMADFAVGLLFFPTEFFCGHLALCERTYVTDLAVLAIYSSTTNLCAMTTDRYIAITKPLRYAVWMTSRRAVMLIALAWALPLTIDYIPALCSRLGKCNLKDTKLLLSKMVIFEILPWLYVLITTAHIITTASRHWRQNARLNSQLLRSQPSHRRRRDFSSAQVIIIVVLIFLASYSVELYSVIRFLAYSLLPTKEVVWVIKFFMIVNSAANPIAYALFKKDIRKELQKTFRMKSAGFRREISRASASTAVWTVSWKLTALNWNAFKSQ